MSVSLSLKGSAALARSILAFPPMGGRRLSILLYHRVHIRKDPLFPGEVDAARFDRQMALVSRAFNCLPLAEAVHRLKEGSLPPRALSITFDDGYADNHDVAMPILQRHGVSACFFVATEFLDGGRMWNDTVIELVRRTNKERLSLDAFGLGTLDIGSHGQRRQAIDRLLGAIKYRDFAGRETALAQLTEVCGSPDLPDDLMMSSDQIRGLVAGGMEVGAHTVRHPILCAIDDGEAEREMRAGREQLQEIIGRKVDLFAYPNGRPDKDYAKRHVDMAIRSGFAAAVTTAVGVSGHGADVFQLPRFTPWDVSAARWLARLCASRSKREFAIASQV